MYISWVTLFTSSILNFGCLKKITFLCFVLLFSLYQYSYCRPIHPFFSFYIFTSIDSSLHKRHKQVLEKFARTLPKVISVDDIN